MVCWVDMDGILENQSDLGGCKREKGEIGRESGKAIKDDSLCPFGIFCH